MANATSFLSFSAIIRAQTRNLLTAVFFFVITMGAKKMADQSKEPFFEGYSIQFEDFFYVFIKLDQTCYLSVKE